MKNLKILILCIILTITSVFTIAKVKMIDQVIAIVNNDIILESDVKEIIKLVNNQAKRRVKQLPDNKILRKHIIENLIIDNILLQIAKKQNIQINNSQLDFTISKIAENSKMSINQLRSSLAYDGINYTRYRETIRKEMLISEVRNNEVRRRITILPQEIDLLAAQIELQNDARTTLNITHILIPVPENFTTNQIKTYKSVVKKLVLEARTNKNFNRLPMIYSNKLQQALQIDNIGWKHIYELPSIFKQALMKAKTGDIIGPIRSEVGFHVIKINAVHNANNRISVKELRARHILIKTSPIISNDQARKKLEEIAIKIHSGQLSFAEAAKHFSQDHDSAHQGGDLGWNSPDVFEPSLRETLMRLKTGEISNPIHSSFGWHLIKLMYTRQADKTNLAQKTRAYQLLFDRKFLEEAQNWIQKQRASAYVKILDSRDN